MRPAAIKSFKPARFMMTTSAGTPRPSCAAIVFGPLPCEAPVAVVTLMPDDFSNSGSSLPNAAEKPPEMITLTCAYDAAGQATIASAVARLMAKRRRGFITAILVRSAVTGGNGLNDERGQGTIPARALDHRTVTVPTIPG